MHQEIGSEFAAPAALLVCLVVATPPAQLHQLRVLALVQLEREPVRWELEPERGRGAVSSCQS